MSPMVSSRRLFMPQRGMILVIVLWIVTLLAVMAGSFAYSMRTEIRLALGAVERARARALAEAGVAYAMAWQLDHDASRKTWPPNGDPREWVFGDGRVRIEVINANGLVSLNTASPDLLKALFSGVGVDAADRDALVEAVLNWSESGQQQMLGRPDRAAGQLSGRFQPRKARFESIEELQQVEGMTKAIYERIADEVTAFSSHLGVNPEFAPAGLLRDLGLDERAVADYVASRAKAAADGSRPPPVPRTSGEGIFFGGRTPIYHITVAAELESGTVVKVKAVTDLQAGIIAQDLRVFAWREGR